MNLGSFLQSTTMIACHDIIYLVRAKDVIALRNLISIFHPSTGRNENHIFNNDKEVICMTELSEPTRLKYGESKFVVLSENRPIEFLTPNIVNFTLARFIRVRLQGEFSSALKLCKFLEFHDFLPPQEC